LSHIACYTEGAVTSLNFTLALVVSVVAML